MIEDYPHRGQVWQHTASQKVYFIEGVSNEPYLNGPREDGKYMQPMVIYRGLNDGKYWTRTPEDFIEKFTRLSVSATETNFMQS